MNGKGPSRRRAMAPMQRTLEVSTLGGMQDEFDELEIHKAVFRKIDQAKRGRLTPSDFVAASERYGTHPLDLDQAEAMVRVLDQSNDGTLDVHELSQVQRSTRFARAHRVSARHLAAQEKMGHLYSCIRDRVLEERAEAAELLAKKELSRALSQRDSVSSMASVQHERRRARKRQTDPDLAEIVEVVRNPHIIDPDGPNLQLWHLVLSVAVCYVVVCTPFLLAFEGLLLGPAGIELTKTVPLSPGWKANASLGSAVAEAVVAAVPLALDSGVSPVDGLRRLVFEAKDLRLDPAGFPSPPAIRVEEFSYELRPWPTHTSSDSILVWWFFGDLVVDFIFVLDIFVVARTGYLGADGRLVRQWGKILLRYLRTWLLVDLVAAIPTALLARVPGLAIVKATRLRHMAKVVRVVRFLRLIRVKRFFTRMDELPMLLARERLFAVGSKSSKSKTLIKSSLAAIVVAHFGACAWFALGIMDSPAVDHRGGFNTGSGVVEDSWITHERVHEKTITQAYMRSVHWWLSTITTVGYGEITVAAATIWECLFAMTGMLLGVAGYSIGVGAMSSAMMYEGRANLAVQSKLSTLMHFAASTAMQFGDYKQLRKHIELKYADRSLTMQDISGQQLRSLTWELPASLRQLLLRRMHQGKHLKLDFFVRFDNIDFFAFVAPCLVSDQFEEDELIYVRHDYADQLYFIVAGTVGCMLSKDGTGDPAIKVHQRQSFGYIEVQLAIPRDHTTKALAEKVECLILKKRDLLQALAEFPTIAERMHREAQDAVMMLRCGGEQEAPAEDAGQGVATADYLTQAADQHPVPEILGDMPNPVAVVIDRVAGHMRELMESVTLLHDRQFELESQVQEVRYLLTRIDTRVQALSLIRATEIHQQVA
mmetsp:Transcript_84445/g.225642  ORF Transcript_84445/g.225642 Transcript_84445/m.225642 type:complete len:880 (+) Transcript_84445:139-2778(+)